MNIYIYIYKHFIHVTFCFNFLKCLVPVSTSTIVMTTSVVTTHVKQPGYRQPQQNLQPLRRLLQLWCTPPLQRQRQLRKQLLCGQLQKQLLQVGFKCLSFLPLFSILFCFKIQEICRCISSLSFAQSPLFLYPSQYIS